jgi:1-deoxy-D-xylulose-5-phosphate reductoisomerase
LQPDRDTFRCLDLACKAINKGGNMPCIMNAANEIAVQSFIDEKISFLDIPVMTNDMMDKGFFISEPTLDDLMETDFEIRMKSQQWIDNKHN